MTLAGLAQQAAANAGIDLAAYAHRVYAFPELAACTWWGLGSVGGNPSSAWINGSFAKKVVGHEMGHNLGLYHAKAEECGSVPVGPSCSELEYGNTIDIMGNPSSGNFNLFAKQRLGWIGAGSSPPITMVASSGPYWISPYSALDGNPKGLKVLKSTDATTSIRTYYYVEFRHPAGNDAFLSSNVNVSTGVVISVGSEANADSNLLLDMTADTTSWSDPALVLGTTFVDPNTGLKIETVAADTTGATVLVTLGEIVAAAPSATVALNTSAPRSNDTLTATATTLDANGDSVTLTYVWKVNGVTKQTSVTANITDTFDLGRAGQGDPGDLIVVNVTPFDGGLAGETVSATATVQKNGKK